MADLRSYPAVFRGAFWFSVAARRVCRLDGTQLERMGHQLRFRSPGSPRAEHAAELTQLERIRALVVRSRAESGAQRTQVLALAARFAARAVSARAGVLSHPAALQLDRRGDKAVKAALAASCARIRPRQSAARLAALRGTFAVA